MRTKAHMELGPDEVAYFETGKGRWEIWPAGDGEQYIDFICKKDNTPYQWWDLQGFTAEDVGCSGKAEGSNELCDFCPLKHGLPAPESYGWVVVHPMVLVQRFWGKQPGMLDDWERFTVAIYENTGNRARYRMTALYAVAKLLGWM